jgi:hypothetical protein
LPSFCNFHGICMGFPPPNPNIKVDIWHPVVDSRCIIPHRHLSQLKAQECSSRVFNWRNCLGGIMHLKPTAGCQISTLIFEKKLWRRGSLLISNDKYIKDGKVLCHLGALKSVKGPGNTFDLNPKWQRTLPSFCNFHGICMGSPPNSNIKVDIWHPVVKPTVGCLISTLIFEIKLWRRGVSINIQW